MIKKTTPYASELETEPTRITDRVRVRFNMERLSLLQLWQREFRSYDGAKFRHDLLAGLTVGAVALPLALAFGVASGSTAAAGMVTGDAGRAAVLKLPPARE